MSIWCHLRSQRKQSSEKLVLFVEAYNSVAGRVPRQCVDWPCTARSEAHADTLNITSARLSPSSPSARLSLDHFALREQAHSVSSQFIAVVAPGPLEVNKRNSLIGTKTSPEQFGQKSNKLSANRGVCTCSRKCSLLNSAMN